MWLYEEGINSSRQINEGHFHFPQSTVLQIVLTYLDRGSSGSKKKANWLIGWCV